MASPLIGITTTRIQAKPARSSFQAVMSTYTDAVASAGGLPVLIPGNMEGLPLTELFTRMDGLLLSGGGDIHPTFYRQTPRVELREVDASRNQMEIVLARMAADARRPLLAICRGLQVVNVALGGDLHQDIASSLPAGLCHDQPEALEHETVHVIEILEGSRLRGIVGDSSLATNSFHHQAVDHIGRGLRVAARTSHGIVEAQELEEHPFGLCVQWHPEKMPDHPTMRSIFASFINAARGAG